MDLFEISNDPIRHLSERGSSVTDLDFSGQELHNDSMFFSEGCCYISYIKEDNEQFTVIYQQNFCNCPLDSEDIVVIS